MSEQAFSIRCPGCHQDLDIAEGIHTIPTHPRHKLEEVPAFEIGDRFPGAVIGTVVVGRPCKWSGALLERKF